MNLYNLIWLFIGVSLIRSIINRLKYGKNSGKNMSRAEYQLYLKSGKWKKKREEVFRYYGKQCVLCGSEENIIVHHRRYDNVTHEPLQDLVPLCIRCHNAYHKSARNKDRHI